MRDDAGLPKGSDGKASTSMSICHNRSYDIGPDGILAVGHMMNLAAVSARTGPKMTLMMAPRIAGHIATPSSMPHRC